MGNRPAGRDKDILSLMAPISWLIRSVTILKIAKIAQSAGPGPTLGYAQISDYS